jgi:hypothetical protein
MARTTNVNICPFAAKRLLRLSWTQKQSCTTVQELSFGVKQVELTPEIAGVFVLKAS